MLEQSDIIVSMTVDKGRVTLQTDYLEQAEPLTFDLEGNIMTV